MAPATVRMNVTRCESRRSVPLPSEASSRVGAQGNAWDACITCYAKSRGSGSPRAGPALPPRRRAGTFIGWRAPGQVFLVRAVSQQSTRDATMIVTPACADVLDVTSVSSSALGQAASDAVIIARGSTQCGELDACPLRRSLCADGECVVPSCPALEGFCRSSTAYGIRARQ
jgi:hypothetical protein